MTDSPGKDARDRARECLRDQKQRDAASGSVAFYHSTSAMVSIETAINAMLAFATTEASLSDGGGEASLRKAVEPWAGYDGDLPDYDDPLHCVFCSGVEYAVRLLAKELGVATWEQCDGTEEFDGDLGGTLMNIVREAMPTDKHGEQMWPSEVREALSSLSQPVEGWRESLRSEIINTPETADFMAAVPLEAAHQRDRWSVDHDAGKSAFDWFWLIGYLAQKAAAAQVAGDTEKAKHHTISTAAALANWHAQLIGLTSMRPGIGPGNGGDQPGSAYDMASALPVPPTLEGPSE